MKILGIGNAIVDVICKVDDSFISQNNLTKGTMKLFFNENEFKKLLNNLKIEKTVSGGSVANSIVGISQLGDKAGFIGKISNDEFGSKYEEGLKTENVEYFYSKKKGRIADRYLFNTDYTRLGKNNVYFPGNSRKNK
jgi:sugar/nucleoside kinase (ribokinase family)